MKNNDGLVERLRSLKWMVHDEMRGLIEDTTAHEAADTIDRLRADLAAAKGERAGIGVSDEGPKPLPSPGVSCFGCAHLSTEAWRQYMHEDDEWDSGTSATCGKTAQHISSYWSQRNSPPGWCPFLAADAIESGADRKDG